MMSRLNPALIPPQTSGVLRSLLEKPTTLHLRQDAGYGSERDEVKSLEEESNTPQSAFLGPTLWDKTFSYDGDGLQLEFMDLEKFLSENEVHSSLTQHDQQTAPVCQGSISVMDLSSRPLAPVHTGMIPQNCLHSPIKAVLPSSRNMPSPIDPESIQIAVSYEPDPADLVLSSIPGQEIFNPRKCKFSEDELRPQPVIKKACKVFIPDGLKDEKYWARRSKNNMAAKRSRDARRLKENQIAIRAGFLEQENMALRQEITELRKELGHCKNIIPKYEALYGQL